MHNFLTELQTLGNFKFIIIKLIFLTILLWFFEISTLYIIILNLNFEISISITTFASILSFLSMAFPLTPGGIGTYETVIGVIIDGLTMYDFQTGFSICLTEHAFRQNYNILLGYIFIISNKIK